ncbi:tetratricopeptide repeat protein [Akkermansiaceae bacterium]|nr:tetratricopeptide repeat protein [Akkermansiaceae bacterium]
MSEPSIEFYNAAVDAIQSGDLTSALSAAENSLTENPSDPETWQLYVMVLSALGRKEDAAKATEKLKELGLSEADEFLMKAAEAVSAGDLNNALRHYESAFLAAPERPEIHSAYALALMQAGKANEAQAAAEKAVSLAPDDSRANYALGHILRVSGDKDAALEALTKAVSAEPEMMIALYEQGMILAEKGRLEEALSNFEKFLEIHPDDPSASEALATIREQMGA